MKTVFLSVAAGALMVCAASTATVAAQTTSTTGSTPSASFTVAPSAPAGSMGVALATLTVNATAGQAISLPSLALNASFNGVPPYDFTNCSVQDTAVLGVPLTASQTLGAGGSTFTFLAPAVVAAGGTGRYALVCDVSPMAPAASSVTLSFNPASIGATSAATGNLAGTVTVTAPVSGSTGGTTSSGGSPSVPNTGFGGDAVATLLIMTLSLSAAYVGSTVLRRMNGSKSTTTPLTS